MGKRPELSGRIVPLSQEVKRPLRTCRLRNRDRNVQTRLVFSPATADWSRRAPTPGSQNSQSVSICTDHEPCIMRKCDTVMAGCLGGMREDMWERDSRKSPSILIVTMAGVVLPAGAAGLLTDAQPWLENPSTNFGWFLTANLPKSAPRVPKQFDSWQGPSILGPSLFGRIEHVKAVLWFGIAEVLAVIGLFVIAAACVLIIFEYTGLPTWACAAIVSAVYWVGRGARGGGVGSRTVRPCRPSTNRPNPDGRRQGNRGVGADALRMRTLPRYRRPSHRNNSEGASRQVIGYEEIEPTTSTERQGSRRYPANHAGAHAW